jgi:hypothetical protein
VLALLGETTKVIAFEGEIDTGLVIPTVPVIVTLKKEDVEFLSWKKVPPLEVERDDGIVTLLNPEFVRYVYVFE